MSGNGQMYLVTTEDEYLHVNLAKKGCLKCLKMVEIVYKWLIMVKDR